MQTGKPSNASSSFPLWTWPEPPKSCSDTIDFGLTGGAFFDLHGGVDSFWTFKNNHNSNFSIKAVSSLEQAFPRTRHYMHPNLKKTHKANIKAVVNYFQANFEDTYIPQSIFEECLSETLFAQESQLHYDPFSGNVATLLTSKLSPDSHHIAFPTGEVGNMLNFTALEQVRGDSSYAYKLNPSTEAVTRFTTPIRQLVTSKSKGEEPDIVGVRTISGVSFLTIRERKQSEIHETPISCKSLHSLSLPTEPMHLAMNPYWVGEAAIVGDKGFLSIWDINSPKTQRAVLDVQNDAVKFTDKWMACEWGAHPRLLVIGSAFDIKMMDLRSSASPSLLYTPSNEKIYGLQRNLDHELQSFFSTTGRVGIIDHRFASRPLLQWKHNQREPPSQLQIFTSPEASGNQVCIIGWSRFESEICMYTYERSPTHGAFSSAGYPISLESFSSHPDYVSDDLVPPIPFKPNKVRRDERDFQRHPPLSGIACLPHWSNTSPSDDGSNLFSLFQYAENGSIYSQVYKINSNKGPSSYIDDEGFFVPGASQSDGVYTQTEDEVTELVAKPKVNWPSSVLEMEKLADRLELTPHDIKRYTKTDMRPLIKYLSSAFLDELSLSSVSIKEEDQVNKTTVHSPNVLGTYLNSLESPATVYDIVQKKDDNRIAKNAQDIVMQVTQSSHLKLDWRGLRATVLYPWDSNANQILELNNLQDIRVLLKSEFESSGSRNNEEESLLLFETLEERSIFGSQTVDMAIEQMTEALFWSSLVHVPIQEITSSNQQDSQVNDSLDLELQNELDEITPKQTRTLDLPLNEWKYLQPQGNIDFNIATKALLQEWSIGDAPPEMDHGIEEYVDIRVKSQSRRTFLKNVPATPLTFKGSRPLITKSVSQPDSAAGRNLYFSPLSRFRQNDHTPPALVSRSQPQAVTPSWRTPHIRASQPSQSTVQTPRTILKSKVKRKLDHFSQSQATPNASTPMALPKTPSWESVPIEPSPPVYETPSTPQFTASQPVAGSTNVRKSKKKKPRMSGF